MLLFYYIPTNMAQVRKLQQGNKLEEVKLFKHDGLGEYNINDLESAYASSITDRVNSLGLSQKDKQAVLTEAGRILGGIKSGAITGRNANGEFVSSDPSFGSSGINQKKIWGYKKNDDFYKNLAYDTISNIFKEVSPYIAPKQGGDTSTKNSDYKLDFEKSLRDYYFNGKDFDLGRWDFSNARTNVLSRLQEERDKIANMDISNKDNLLSRLDETISDFQVNNPNFNTLGARIGVDFRPYLLEDYVRLTPEERQAQAVANDQRQQEEQAFAQQEQALREAQTYTNGNNKVYFDPNSRKTYEGAVKNRIFIPEDGSAPFPVDQDITWDRYNPNYYSQNNLNTLTELLGYDSYRDNAGQFWESLQNRPLTLDLSDRVLQWLEAYQATLPSPNEPIENNYNINFSPFSGWSSTPTSEGGRSGSLLNPFQRPVIEEGSLTDKRLRLTSMLGDRVKRFLGEPSNRKEGGTIPKHQTGQRIQARDMSRWNRTNALTSYDWGADIDDYLKSGSDLPNYITAFNGGEDIYDTLVGNTDYFNNIGVKYTASPIAEQRQRTFRNTNKRFDDAIRSTIAGYGNTEGVESYDTYLGDRTYNRTLGRITPEQANSYNSNYLYGRGLELYPNENGYYRLRQYNSSNSSSVATPTYTNSNEAVGLQGNTPQEVVSNVFGENGNNAQTVFGRARGLNSNPRRTPDIQWDEVIGTGRLIGTVATNNRIASGLKKSLKPLLIDAPNIQRRVTGDLPTTSYLQRLAGDANRLGNRAISSDANVQLAQQLAYNNQANELKLRGLLADKQAIDQTSAAAQQAEEQNQISRVDVANRNRASMLGIRQAKANIEAQRKSANWAGAIAPWLMDKEFKIAQSNRINNELNYDANQRVVGNAYQDSINLASTQYENARNAFIQSGRSEAEWEGSPQQVAARNAYERVLKQAGNDYYDGVSTARRKSLGYRPFISYAASGTKLSYAEKSALERAKTVNKHLLEDTKEFNRLIRSSQKENNRMLRGLSGVTKDLIIKSMTL